MLYSRRKFLTAAACSALIGTEAFAQLAQTGAGKTGAAAAPNLTSLDGSVSKTTSGVGPYTTTLSTTQTNDIIIVATVINSNDIVSVADVAGLTWARRAGPLISGASHLEIWWAFSAGILTGDIITIIATGANFCSSVAFGIHGANTGAPFDTNAGLPATNAAGGASISTDNANDFLIGLGLTGGVSTAGPGWTLIRGDNFQLVEYQIVTATQAGTPVTVSSGTLSGSIGDAVRSA